MKIHNADCATTTKNFPARTTGEFHSIIKCPTGVVYIHLCTGDDVYYENHKTSCDWSHRYYWVKWVCLSTSTLFVVPHLKNRYQKSIGFEIPLEEFAEHIC